MNQERDFKGIWIARSLWLNESLSIQEKCLLAEIDSLDKNNQGCFATNEYLGKFVGLSGKRVANILTHLRKIDLVEQLSFDGRNRKLRVKWESCIPKYGNPPIPDQGWSIPESGKPPLNSYKETITNPEKSFSDEVVRIYDWCIKFMFPYRYLPATDKQIEDWKDTIRKLIEIDNRELGEICNVIKFGRTDSFWISNFLSIKGLREKNKSGIMKYDNIKEKYLRSIKPLEDEPPKIIPTKDYSDDPTKRWNPKSHEWEHVNTFYDKENNVYIPLD